MEKAQSDETSDLVRISIPPEATREDAEGFRRYNGQEALVLEGTVFLLVAR